MLRIENLRACYGPVEALHGISLEVSEGEFAAIVGANGAGKSTLLMAVAGLLSERTGRVVFGGRELPPGRPDLATARGLALVAEAREIFGPLTVEDNLLLGAYTRGGGGAAVRAEMERVFKLFPVLAERRRAQASTLSGGQQQMLAIARALMSRPRMLLMDEPSLGLAPLVVREIFTHYRGSAPKRADGPFGGTERPSRALPGGQGICPRERRRRPGGHGRGIAPRRGHAPRLPRGGAHGRLEHQGIDKEKSLRRTRSSAGGD